MKSLVDDLKVAYDETVDTPEGIATNPSNRAH